MGGNMGNRRRFLALLTCFFCSATSLHPAAGAGSCRDVEDGVRMSSRLLKQAEMTFQEIIDCVPAGGSVWFEGGASYRLQSTIIVKRPIELKGDGVGGDDDDDDKLKPELSCGNEGSLFDIRSGGVTLENLRIANCSLEASGSSAVVVDIPAGSSSEEEVLFSGVDFVSNKNKYGPGALLIRAARLVVFENSTFVGNEGENGGGLEVTSPNIEVLFNGCILRDNRAARRGGALYYNPLDQENEELSTIIVRQSMLKGNVAMGMAEEVNSSGGAIALGVSHLSLLMTQSHMMNNSASGYGGALWLKPSSLNRDVHIAIHETVLMRNQAAYGGAIALGLQNARCTISSSMIVDNMATGKVLMQDGMGKGGGLFLVHPESVLIKGSLFRGNSALPATAVKRNDRKLLQMTGSNRNSMVNQTAADGGLQEVPLNTKDSILLHRADDPFEQLGWDVVAGSGPDVDKMLTQTSAAFGGSIFLLGLGLQQKARVAGAPISSSCSRQCVPDPPENANLTDVVDGCGLQGDHRICVLKNRSSCNSFLNVQKKYLKPNGPWVAICTVDAYGTRLEAVDSQFIDGVSQNGGAIAALAGAAVSLHEQTNFINNSAQKHGGAIYTGSKTKISGLNVSFTENRAGEYGGAIILKGADNMVELEFAHFQLNAAVEGSGGAISAQGLNGMILLKRSVSFISNMAGVNGGAMAIESKTIVAEMKSSLFESNQANLGGGAFYAKATLGAVRITFKDVDFHYNSVASAPDQKLRHGGLGGAMLLEGVAVNVVLSGTQNTFVGNEAREGGAVRIIDAGGFEVATAYFKLNKALTGGGMHATFTGKTLSRSFVLRNTTFLANSAFMGGGLMADAKTARAAFISNDALSSTMFGTYDEIHSSKLKIELYGLRMNDQSAVQHGGGMLLLDIEASCEYCEFSNNRVEKMYNGEGGAVSIQDSATLSIDTSVFTDNQAPIGGALHSRDSIVRARDIRFSHNIAHQKGGAIAVQSTLKTYEQLQMVFELHNSVVESNEAIVGGGLHLEILPWYNNDVCTPLSFNMGLEPNAYNRVISDIQEYCEVNGKRSGASNSESVQLEDVTLWNNKAEEAGGGLFVTNPDYVCACCSGDCTTSCKNDIPLADINVHTLLNVCRDLWSGNSVQQYGYGNTVATSAVRSDVRLENGKEWIIRDGLIEHNSGDPLEPFTVRLLDAFGEVVTNTPGNLFVRLSSEMGILSGQVDKEVNKGLAKFESTIVAGRPEMHVLTIQLPIELNIGYDWVSLQIRNCTRGEQTLDASFTQFRCVPCRGGTLSLYPGGHCEPCPQNSICNGQTAVPKDGFWHASADSVWSRRCLSERACTYPGRTSTLQLESVAFNNILSYKDNYTLCRQGYTGVLCGSCEEGYERFGAFECRKCWSNHLSILLGMAAFSWVVLVVVLLIRASHYSNNSFLDGSCSHRESVEASRGTQSIFSLSREQSGLDCDLNMCTENAKILLNFMQITSLAMVLNTKWMEEAQIFFEIEDVLSGNSASGLSLVSVGCIEQIFGFMTSMPIALTGLLFPLMIAVLATAFWMIKSLLTSKCFIDSCIGSLGIILYLFYLGVTKRALGIFHLVRVDGILDDSGVSASLWADDTGFTYFSGSHSILAFLGLAFIALWTLCFPIGFVVLLIFNSESVNQQRYGFLCQAYRKECLYWEGIVMLRKTALAAVAVLAFSFNGNLQCTITLFIMILSLAAHLIVQPYKSQLATVSSKETISLCGSTFVYMVALVLKDDAASKQVRTILSVVSTIVCIGITLFFTLSTILREVPVTRRCKQQARGAGLLSRMNFLKKFKQNMQHRWDVHMDRLWMRIGELFLQNLDDGESVCTLDDKPSPSTQTRRAESDFI